MRKVMRVGVSSGLLLMLGVIGYLNYALYYQPEFIYSGNGGLNSELLCQLRYLKNKLHEGAADDMQSIYPEGFVFLNALYGLTWTELAGNSPKDADLFQEALYETDWAIQEINSLKGKAPFSPELNLPYGAFYNGWLTYVVGKRLSLLPAGEHNAAQIALFQSNCDRIASVLAQAQSPFLESYPGQAWPADGVVCVASLAMHDQLFEPQYSGLLKEWVMKVRQREDTLGLIPHQSKPFTGMVVEPARGSSQSLILIFLAKIDSEYARQKFAMYKKHFLVYRLGLPAIREYPKGSQGQEDIDSGPVLFDAGGAASIVGRRTMQQYGEKMLALALRNSIEAFGMPFTKAGRKRYLAGMLPIADAFIGWSNGLESGRALRVETNWRTPFQLISATGVAGILMVLGWLWKAKIVRQNKKYK